MKGLSAMGNRLTAQKVRTIDRFEPDISGDETAKEATEDVNQTVENDGPPSDEDPPDTLNGDGEQITLF